MHIFDSIYLKIPSTSSSEQHYAGKSHLKKIQKWMRVRIGQVGFSGGFSNRLHLNLHLHPLPFTPLTVFLQPCNLHPVPCTMHSAPCTMYPALCTLHSVSGSACTYHRCFAPMSVLLLKLFRSVPMLGCYLKCPDMAKAVLNIPCPHLQCNIP